MERPSLAEWGAWKSDLTTKKVLAFLRSIEQDVIDGLVSGSYKTYSEVECARGTIAGLRMIDEMPRGEKH
jgi:hypothetical protein